MPTFETGLDFKQMPTAEQEDLSKTDEAVSSAFSAAAAALGGPQAAAFADWWVHGGAAWIGKAVLWVLPDGWVAQGAYTWIDSVIEPVRAQAIDVDRLLSRASRDAYRLLLEAHGLVGHDDFTSKALQWETVRDRIPDAGFLSFPDYVNKLARAQGYGAFRSVYLGESAYAKLFSEPECRKLQGGSGFLPYCVKLEGVTNEPTQAFVGLVATGLAKSFDAYRLQPKLRALTQAVANAEAVLPSNQTRAAMAAWATRATATRRRRIVAAMLCGIVGASTVAAAAYLPRR